MIESGIIESGWTTADYAFVISIFSALLALLSLGWNVWSKFIYPKPVVRVSMSKMETILDGQGPSNPCVAIHVTNFGPAQVTIRNVVAGQKTSVWRRTFTLGLLNPYNAYPHDLGTKGPFSGGLPKKLDVGEEFSSFFPATPDWFQKNNWNRFGFLDTFGRYHWCQKKDVLTVKHEVLGIGVEND